MIMVPSRPGQSEIALVGRVPIGSSLRGQESFVVPRMGARTVLLLFNGESHVCNLHIPGKGGYMPRLPVVARVAFMWGVETTGGTVKPIVVPFYRMLGVAAT
jgi:hypothetical protein